VYYSVPGARTQLRIRDLRKLKTHRVTVKLRTYDAKPYRATIISSVVRELKYGWKYRAREGFFSRKVPRFMGSTKSSTKCYLGYVKIVCFLPRFLSSTLCNASVTPGGLFGPRGIFDRADFNYGFYYSTRIPRNMRRAHSKRYTFLNIHASTFLVIRSNKST